MGIGDYGFEKGMCVYVVLLCEHVKKDVMEFLCAINGS